MEIRDIDKNEVRALWKLPKERQRLQMLIYQAIADSTELPAKDVEAVLSTLGTLLEEEETEVTKKDQAL